MRCKAESYDINIEPDDIEVSDTVTVVWEIILFTEVKYHGYHNQSVLHRNKRQCP